MDDDRKRAVLASPDPVAGIASGTRHLTSVRTTRAGRRHGGEGAGTGRAGEGLNNTVDRETDWGVRGNGGDGSLDCEGQPRLL
jgi:hypothetical protein